MTVGGLILTVTVAFAVTAVLTPLFRSAALRIGWEHRPDPKKWKRNANPHSVRIALGGGLTMFVGIIVSALVCSAVLLSPSQHQLLFISLLFATCALLLGLYDDWRSPRPVVRLAFQAILGILTVSLLGWVKGLPALLAIANHRLRSCGAYELGQHDGQHGRRCEWIDDLDNGWLCAFGHFDEKRNGYFTEPYGCRGNFRLLALQQTSSPHLHGRYWQFDAWLLVGGHRDDFYMGRIPPLVWATFCSFAFGERFHYGHDFCGLVEVVAWFARDARGPKSYKPQVGGLAWSFRVAR
jgi:hypothetical protein